MAILLSQLTLIAAISAVNLQQISAEGLSGKEARKLMKVKQHTSLPVDKFKKLVHVFVDTICPPY